MSERPSWLLALEPVAGAQADVIAALYRVFVASFSVELSFQGLPVALDRGISQGAMYENGFWHLVSRQGQRMGERRFDPRRGERVAWCAAIVANWTDPAVKVWDYLEGRGRLRTYLWLEQFDYVVILEQRTSRNGDVVYIVTGYWVDGPARRRTLFRKFRERRA